MTYEQIAHLLLKIEYHGMEIDKDVEMRVCVS